MERNLSSEKGVKTKDVSKETEAIWHHTVEGEDGDESLFVDGIKAMQTFMTRGNLELNHMVKLVVNSFLKPCGALDEESRKQELIGGVAPTPCCKGPPRRHSPHAQPRHPHRYCRLGSTATKSPSWRCWCIGMVLCLRAGNDPSYAEDPSHCGGHSAAGPGCRV